jgi:hypothetical protein
VPAKASPAEGDGTTIIERFRPANDFGRLGGGATSFSPQTLPIPVSGPM